MTSSASTRLKGLVKHMSSTTTPSVTAAPSISEPGNGTKTPTEGANEDAVLHREEYAAGIYTLNRPKARNALTLDMIQSLRNQVKKWNDSELINIIIGTGKGDFCSGGDVKALVQAIREPKTQHEAIGFFKEEFMLDWELSQLSKPYITIMDGITMGGGVGLCLGAPFRVATERTLFAMPETAIGYFTDVGATHFLSHLDGQLGMYLGLTSAQVKGREVFECGIATHYVPSRNIPLLIERLSRLENATASIIAEAIDEFYEARTPDDSPQQFIGSVRNAIDQAFGASEPVAILGKLEELGIGENVQVATWAKEAENMMRERSPTSICVTWEAISRAREKSYRRALETEMRIAQAYCTTIAGDFVEGVEAKLVLKQKPSWKPNSLSDVNLQSVKALVSSEDPLPEGFVLDQVAGSSQRWYGLPKEEEVKGILMKDSQKGRKRSEREVLDEMEIELKGKQGVRERVLEILSRKTGSVDEGLVWL